MNRLRTVCENTGPESLPPALLRIAVAVAVVGFLAVLAVAAGKPSPWLVAAAPLGFVAALWAVPFVLALVRGRSWPLVVYLVLLVVITDGNFRSRAWNDYSFDWQVLLKGIVWAGAGLIGLVRLPASGHVLARAPVAWLAALIVLMTASALWSPVPQYTLLSGAGFACFFLFALALWERCSETEILVGMAVGFGLLVVPSLAIAPFAHSFAAVTKGSTGEVDRLRGFAGHPIGLANDAVWFTLACGLLAARYPRWRLGLLALMLAAAAVVLLTRSRMPPLAMATAVLLVLAWRRDAWVLFLPLVLALVLGVAIAATTMGLDEILPKDVLRLFSRSGTATEVMTLTGRVQVWQFVWDKITQAPLLGHGHASARVTLHDFRQWSLGHSHNAFLQALLYTGFVGATLTVLSLSSILVAFFRRSDLLRDVVLFYLLIIGITEESFFGNMPGSEVLLWALAAALCVAPAGAWRSRKKEGASRPLPDVVPSRQTRLTPDGAR